MNPWEGHDPKNRRRFNRLRRDGLLTELNQSARAPIPEHRLLNAIIDRALRDIYGFKDIIQPSMSELAELVEWAVGWRSEEAFGLTWCCDHLGYEPRLLASWIVYWARRRGVQIPEKPWRLEVAEDDEELQGILRGVESLLWRDARRSGGRVLC